MGPSPLDVGLRHGKASVLSNTGVPPAPSAGKSLILSFPRLGSVGNQMSALHSPRLCTCSLSPSKHCCQSRRPSREPPADYYMEAMSRPGPCTQLQNYTLLRNKTVNRGWRDGSAGRNNTRLLERTQVQVPTPILWLTTLHNSSSKGPEH